MSLPYRLMARVRADSISEESLYLLHSTLMIQSFELGAETNHSIYLDAYSPYDCGHTLNVRLFCLYLMVLIEPNPF